MWNKQENLEFNAKSRPDTASGRRQDETESMKEQDINIQNERNQITNDDEYDYLFEDDEVDQEAPLNKFGGNVEYDEEDLFENSSFLQENSKHLKYFEERENLLKNRIIELAEKVKKQKEKIREIKKINNIYKERNKELNSQVLKERSKKADLGNIVNQIFYFEKNLDIDDTVHLYADEYRFEKECVNIERRNQNNLWKRILNNRHLRKIQDFFRKYIFLKHFMTKIHSKFGEGVATFFNFYRWQMINSVLVAFFVFCIYIWQFIYLFKWQSHLISDENGKITFSSLWGDDYFAIPKVLSYESFSHDTIGSIIYFTLTFGSILLFAFTGAVKIIYEGRNQARFAVRSKDTEGKEFSSLLLNSWNFSIKDKKKVTEQFFTILENVKILLNEKHMREEINNRTFKTKLLLILRKIIGNLLVLLILVITWTTFIFLKFFRPIIDELLFGIGTLIVPIAVSILNFVMPTAVIKISKFEKWDNPAVDIMFTVVRLYLLKIVSVLLLMFDFFKAFKLQTNDNSICLENEIGTQLTVLLISNFFIGKILVVFKSLFKILRIKFRDLVGLENEDGWKDVFYTPPRVITLIHFQSIVWLGLPFAPIIIIIGAILHILSFIIDFFATIYTQEKPKKAFKARDTGFLFMILYIFTFILSLILYYFFYANAQHYCGPHVGKESINFFKDLVDQHVITYYLYRIISNPLLLWVILVSIFIIYLRRRDRIKSLHKYVNLLVDRMQKENKIFETKITNQNEELEKYKEQLSVLRRRRR